MIEQLGNQWLNELQGTAADSVLRNIFDKLCALYQQPHRAYHNLHHIAALLELAESHRTDLRDFRAVYLSIWFHDAVYRPLLKNNEEASAALARQELKALQISASELDKISRYILATKHHEPSDDSDLQWLLDFDLAILSSPPEVYEAYTRQIRQEYGMFPDLIYRLGRKKAMSKFVERPAIYGKLGDRAEQQARLNITLEISKL